MQVRIKSDTPCSTRTSNSRAGLWLQYAAAAKLVFAYRFALGTEWLLQVLMISEVSKHSCISQNAHLRQEDAKQPHGQSSELVLFDQLV